jgi:hypothetical protein
MNNHESSHPNRPSVKSSLIKAGIGLTLAIGIIIYLFWFSGRERITPEIKEPALQVTPSAKVNPAMTNEEKRVFFDKKINPLLARNQAANAEALKKFKENIHSQFEGYRGKVPVFVGDITGWGNKSKIMWESAMQIGSVDKKKVERHVTQKFNADVVSADQIRSNLEDQVRAFQQDIEANRNEMLTAIDAAVSSDPRLSLGVVTLSKAFLIELNENIKSVTTKAGVDGAVLGGMSLLAGVAVEETVRILTTAIYVRVASSIGSSMAATATTAGGATAVVAAGGGSAGSLGGPPGAAVGVAVGLIFGGVVDWFMTNKLEEKLNTQCKDFLTSTEQSITSDAQGLVAQLQSALTEIDKSTGPIIRKQLGILP